jgi:hypothetical protein
MLTGTFDKGVFYFRNSIMTWELSSRELGYIIRTGWNYDGPFQQGAMGDGRG